MTIDMDATSVTAHSEMELAAPTFKRGFGFHPLFAFADHGEDRSGEALAGMVRTDTGGNPRDGAQVAELTAYLPATLRGSPAGMRVIARRERPPPRRPAAVDRPRRLADWVNRRMLVSLLK